MGNNDELKQTNKLILRNLQAEDYGDVKRIMDRVYPTLGGWTIEEFSAQLSTFPEGQICIEDDGKVIAAAQSLIVDYNTYGDRHTYDQITGNCLLSTHDPKGDTLYGLDIYVDPDYQGLRLGRRLYDARKELCYRLNLKRIIAGGRIPGYAAHAHEMTPSKYIERVKDKELRDHVLGFQLANDFHVRRVLKGYLKGDAASREYATLLEWSNVDYEEPHTHPTVNRGIIRVSVVQWQMRSVKSVEEFLDQVEFFVDAMAGYKADFVLFPEFFNAPLMALRSDENQETAIRTVAAYTDTLVEKIGQFAVRYNINIIAGSMPEYDGNTLYNASYLCRRDGTKDAQKKLHITPDEEAYWGMHGGDKLCVFETDVGRVGILVCYDVEYPELPRLLAEQGIDILFVPYWTDTKNSYLRVRRCAQARAIENECYVAISGSVGTLPKVENMDIQYSQAAVFSPSDFAFPHDAIMAEATPNTEMTLVADLDISLLKELRERGSVRNMRSRRHDLYSLRWRGDKEDFLVVKG
ncbi:bifunctional GNAT family N-acetyltransferase/carbon-nitrogen hydrolase family protein [Sulfurospirillum sp. MES]|uniref:bifunctional GNAT family N-acetyltransferase/carbon-nitrogen hydrolase family protein n=1 Tax=Sulfurospirillum sp. MES TaxID=1565314 RepID=UPI0005438227|nr:bifunctional GNAT family N-acetyltransferase/carbon-nitrogen hydrolase family protein [Sulfurospirillum sp. MES]KHG32886.1 MAG: hydrolase [Sulfurospirillum sp. MES]